MDAESIFGIQNSEKPLIMLATVAGVFSQGLTLVFDGEGAGQKKYKRLASYSGPAQNDRVLVAIVSGSAVVLGKII